MAKITLKYGQFFFAGNISINGLGSVVEVDEILLDPTIRKALDIAKASGVIDHDMEELNIESETLFFHGENTLEEPVVEEKPSEVKSGKKIKRG